MNHTLQKLSQIGIIPITPLKTPSDAVPLARALCDGGLPCIAVTFHPEVTEATIRTLTTQFPEMLVGADNVLTTEQVDRAAAAGAKFITGAASDPQIAAYCTEKGIPFLSGCTSSDEKTATTPDTDIMLFSLSETTDETDLIAARDWAGITARTKEAVFAMLGFHIAHVGINCATDAEAASTASLFATMLGQPIVEGPKNFFPGPDIELMKPGFGRGKNGHIAIAANNLTRTMYHLEKRGFSFDEASFKYDEKGNVTFAYLTDDICGFGVHFIQK